MGNLIHRCSNKLNKKSKCTVPHTPDVPSLRSYAESISSPPQSATPSINSDVFSCPASISDNNGITGKYISQRLVSIAVGFWSMHIESLSASDKLEIGATLFFEMIASSNEIRTITRNISSASNDFNLKQHSLQILDMIAYLLKSLARNDIDFESTLVTLGALHANIGVKKHHFDIMIRSFHESLLYYFPKAYDMNVQYAMDQIITISTEIMTRDKKLKRTKSFHGASAVFLESLESCLASDVGTEYFHRYLENRYCHEVSVYLKLMRKFRNQFKDQERYQVAKEIVRCCILSESEFAINISYETRKNILDELHKLEDEWLSIPIAIDFFESVEMEMRRLIVKNHWFKFVESFGNLRNSVSLNINI